jgi:hypothetical protein
VLNIWLNMMRMAISKLTGNIPTYARSAIPGGVVVEDGLRPVSPASVPILQISKKPVPKN